MTRTLTPLTDETNRWFHDETAEAFWDQHRALPYRELLSDTIGWCEPSKGEAWLDLGCGGGFLTQGLWKASKGQVASVHAADCAEANRAVIQKLSQNFQPAPTAEQIRFSVVDFSKGLPQFEDSSFDGIVSGLAISYAESFDLVKQQFTDAAYTKLYHEMFRVLKPGGKLVFSVNVPNPDFWKIVWKSFGKGVKIGKPWRTIKNVWNMQKHGSWLKREAVRGRFHFEPLVKILKRVQMAGFENWSSKLSYADQAFVVRSNKPHAMQRLQVA
jgi:SAM-dependent methyltransferase